MKKAVSCIVTASMLSPAAAPMAGAYYEPNAPAIYIAGDSTAQTYDHTKVYPQTGWGQVFSDFFTDDVVIDNRSMGGRSAKRFDDDGRLDAILDEIKPGDYLFIQFGINDGDVSKPERYISVEDYKTLITEKYIGEVEKRGGIPVLMTPSAAVWWDEENNNFMESRADYADPTRALAAELGCRFIDANRITTDTYNSMDKDEVLSGYFICEPLESAAYPAGTDDHTHLKEKGARLMAKLIAEAIPENVPELAKYLKGDEVFTDISGHWAEENIKTAQENGYVDGIGDGLFDPDANVTRAEFLKMAMDAAGIPGHAYREGECLDSTTEDWYCYYLQGALDKGLIPLEMLGGTADREAAVKTVAEATEEKEAVTADIWSYTGEFNGNTPITREEMAVIAMNCLSYAAKHSDKEVREKGYDGQRIGYKDINEKYINSVEDAYSYGIVDGMETGSFHPKENLTRAQAVTVINRMAEKLQ